MSYETIEINRERIRARRPFNIHVADLTAWPDQEFLLKFDYNGYNEQWYWEADHIGTDLGISRSRVTIGVRHHIWPFIMFKFKDMYGTESTASTENIGDEVKLCVFPGPRGGSFLPEAEISEDEEDRLLQRDRFAPVG